MKLGPIGKNIPRAAGGYSVVKERSGEGAESDTLLDPSIARSVWVPVGLRVQVHYGK
jgi:hypothetical protein